MSHLSPSTLYIKMCSTAATKCIKPILFVYLCSWILTRVPSVSPLPLDVPDKHRCTIKINHHYSTDLNTKPFHIYAFIMCVYKGYNVILPLKFRSIKCHWNVVTSISYTLNKYILDTCISHIQSHIYIKFYSWYLISTYC